MLTVHSSTRDRVLGLESGADDYLAKPFDSAELLARVKALLRRLGHTAPEPVTRYRFGSVVADFESRRVTRKNKPVSLTAKELQLLHFLINHRGQIVTRESAIASVWPEQPFITIRTVDVHMAWLRQKLEDDPQKPVHLITVRGAGYRFETLTLRPDRTSGTPGLAGLLAAERNLPIVGRAVSIIGTAVVLVDHNAQFRFANPAACKLLGVSRTELLGLSLGDFDIGFASARWSDTWREIRRAGSLVFESRARTSAGKRVPVELCANYFSHDNHDFLLVEIRDISVRRQHEIDSRCALRRLESLIDSLPVAISRIGLDGRFLIVNPALAKEVNLPISEILGKTPMAIFGAYDEAEQQAHDERIQTVFRTGTPITAATVWQSPYRTRHIETVHIPEFDDTTSVVSVLSITRNLTEAKEQELALTGLRRDLDLATRCRQRMTAATDETQMLSDVCHQICGDGGHNLAWIGHTEKQTIRVAAWAGDTTDLEERRLTTRETTSGKHPVTRAVRDRQSVICRNLSLDPEIAGSLRWAIRRGYRTCLAVPLLDDRRKAAGILTIYSTQAGRFTADSVAVFEGLADDIRFHSNRLRSRL